MSVEQEYKRIFIAHKNNLSGKNKITLKNSQLSYIIDVDF